MTRRVDTWMPLMVDKYLGDTTHLTTEQHGAYLLLLMAAWKRDGQLPNDDAQLAQITRMTLAKWKSARAVVLAFFSLDGDKLTQKRLSEELQRAKDLSEKKAVAGKEGAANRWGSESSAASRSQRLAEARSKGRHTTEEWETLCDLMGHRCVKCGIHRADLPGNALTKDHIVPIYQGGDDSIRNIQPMCMTCNRKKGNDRHDYRQDRDGMWSERLAERLANVSQTSAPIPIPIQKPISLANARESSPPEKPVGKALPSCPIEEIIAAYHEALPQCPRLLVRNATRDGYIRSRWRDVFAAGKATSPSDGLQLFREFFAHVAESKFLTGRAAGANGSPPFLADLEWLMRPTNFAKVVEGKYHR